MTTTQPREQRGWAIVLGGSSGMGLAIAQQLAQMGFELAVVYREPKSRLKCLTPILAGMRSDGTQVLEFNVDATTDAGITKITDALRVAGAEARVQVVVHSLARGNLKPLLGSATQQSGGCSVLSSQDLALTINAMGSSLLAWVQALAGKELLATDSRVIALTSEGSQRVWPGYAAVSAAKASLEALVRAIAVEFGPRGVRCNAVQAGISDTPSLRQVPGAATLLERAAKRNPLGRATQPSDVAQAVSLLCRKEAHWINGSIVVVDGGESVC